MSRVAVVGSGIAGLAASIRLALKGHAVSVFEKADGPGGKMNEFRAGGFRFDTGPSLLTLPHLIQELFQEAGENPDASLRFKKLDLITRYFFPDGTILNAWSDVDSFSQEVEQKLGISGQGVRDYLDQSRELYELTADLFLFSPFRLRELKDRPEARRIAANPLKLLSHKRLHSHNRVLKDPRLIQLFDRYATYNGSDPFQAPATLSIIPHLEHSLGAYFPEQGMYAIASQLHQLGTRLGVRYHFGAAVTGILTLNQRITGLEIAGTKSDWDLVVNNADMRYTYQHLLRSHKPSFVQRLGQPSTSALIFYWGMNGSFPKLAMHSIFFSRDYRKEFQFLRQGKVSPDPTVYVFVSSKLVASDAPEGCENWFVMVNVPPNQGQNWEEIIPLVRKNILSKLEEHLGQPLESRILTESTLDPRGIESRTSSVGGSLYGSSSNSAFSAFLRHPVRHTSIRNLFFVGGSVHPGGGIPLCLASAKIMSDEVD